MSLGFLLVSILLFFLVAVIAMLNARAGWTPAFVYRASTVISLSALTAALVAVAQASVSHLVLPIGLPWLGANFRLDALSGVFVAIANLGGLAASVFALGHGRQERDPERVLPFFPAFLAAMNLVVIADDAFVFLFAWELMSLMSWALVVAHDRSAENLRAGYVYILMASFGTFCLLLALAILAGPDGNYSFEAMRDLSLTGEKAALVVGLVVLGAGSKAGLVPLHAWLPLAHPAAPSHVSALMSGVMTKIAVYAFIRVVFDLLGPVDWRLAMAIVAIGSVTALLGVLYALMQHDLKKLLAYHTVENIGIIFVGLGLALAFRADGLYFAAALAATAAIFHVFNHSVFKSLLFFGAGAILDATGEREMDHLGGLIHRMPLTALAFLIGAAAISALPPLNGFASEWMVFQAIFLSPGFPQWGLRFVAPAAGAILALSAALAAACFVKAFGVTFLGRARREAALNASETDKSSRTAMFGLAGLCIVAGAVPTFFTRVLSGVAQQLTSASVPSSRLAEPWLPLLPTQGSHNSYGALVVLAFIVGAVAVLILFVRPRVRTGPAWDCGFPDASAATQYSAGSFAQPIRRVFGTLAFAARERVVMPGPGDTTAASFEVSLTDPAWEAFYAPIGRAIGFATDRINRLQFLTIRRYLVVVFVTLIFLLTLLVIFL